MSFSLDAVAVGFSAAAVSEGQRTGQSIGRNFQTAEQGILALAQASGVNTFLSLAEFA